jgi:RNA polymerase sigma factor (sigma-70 family)
VSNPAYADPECTAFHISESSPSKAYESESQQLEWNEDEIEAVRVVLKKLTALRIMNINDAEDLVQDTLLTLITKHPGHELEKGLLVWSMGILRKKVGNYYRKARRHTLFHQNEAGARNGIRPSNPSASPEMHVWNKELRGIVEEKLAQLPSSQREAMELLVAGFKTGEIVKRLHPERYQNVVNRLYRGRKKLAHELAKYGYGPNRKTGLKIARPGKK